MLRKEARVKTAGPGKKFQPLGVSQRNGATKKLGVLRPASTKVLTSKFLSGGAVARRVYVGPVSRMLAPPARLTPDSPSPSPSPPPASPDPEALPDPEADAVDETDYADEVDRAIGSRAIIVLHDPEVEAHLVGPERQERPERTVAARACAERFFGRHECVRADWAAGAAVEAAEVTAAILRAHSERYYRSIEAACLGGPGGGAIFPLTPAGDAVGCAASLGAARAAAAVGLAGARAVARGDAACAVCLVRPPGHHVARDGRGAVAPSQGFCLLNTVAIAALEAATRLGRARVAVVDFDVHHGNGTEDILRGDDRFFFASVHAYGGGTYPGTGGPRALGDAPNVLNVPIRGTVSRRAFEIAVDAVAAAVADFGPDLVLLSAGFDGHRDDLAGLGSLSAADYGRCTTTLLAAARGAAVVSVLEGGYGRWCAPKRKKPAKPADGGLGAAVDDARLSSFNLCLDAHLEAIAAFYAPRPPASPSTLGSPPGARASRRLTFDEADS